MKKTYLLAGLGIGLVAIAATSVALAANGDYSSWRKIMGNRGGEAVNEQNFNNFVDMHRLIGEGKYDDAQKIRTELGLGQEGSNGAGGCGMHSVNNAERGGGCGMQASESPKEGGCGMHNGDAEKIFTDENKDGTCDHAKTVTK